MAMEVGNITITVKVELDQATFDATMAKIQALKDAVAQCNALQDQIQQKALETGQAVAEALAGTQIKVTDNDLYRRLVQDRAKLESGRG